jgi:hypothetical protein
VMTAKLLESDLADGVLNDQEAVAQLNDLVLQVDLFVAAWYDQELVVQVNYS